MLLRADARALPMRDGCVQCVVTSPPYFGLRDYGTAQWDGGDLACSHRAPDEAGQTTKPTAGQREHAGRFAGSTCWRCGAQRVDRQLGLEATPAAYVAALVAVFREVWRVLKDDGVCWVNLGDSFAGGNGGRGDAAGLPRGDGTWKGPSLKHNGARLTRMNGDAKPKDLLGIPWRVAFALQADGWYLRADIIWSKPNPMPESVTDRPTKAHEYLFLLTKRERYYYDANAIAEGTIYPPGTREDVKKGGFVSKYAGDVARIGDESFRAIRESRNKRSVWTIPTMPYAGAHFATFPEALVEPCILAGCPLGGLVLDPFLGSGTVGAVAERLSRRWVGTDLAYHDLATERTAQRGFRFEFDRAGYERRRTRRSV